MITRLARRLALAIALVLPGMPASAEFRSVAEGAAVMYDAPSAKATKLYVVGRDYPLEVLVALQSWTKVRDGSGEVAWMENKSLGNRRTVIVNVPLADVRQAADAGAPVLFRAEQNVVLELQEYGVPGWIKVRSRDGRTGYVAASQVWGG